MSAFEVDVIARTLTQTFLAPRYTEDALASGGPISWLIPKACPFGPTGTRNYKGELHKGLGPCR